MSFLSIVIPSYNCQDTIHDLLQSILKSKKVQLKSIELVIVDDTSTDNSVKVITKWIKKHGKSFSHCSHVELKENSGPAHARNIGVKYAKGKVILFLDSDVVLYKNTLYELINSFQSDPDLFALTGVWSKTQRSNHFFRKFKALRDWSYWINERDPKNYYYLFSTRIAAINRELFLRLGGFDDTYKAALVEDIELTYRIARRYAVVFNPRVMVAHEFEDFYPVAKKYFWRSFYWSKIYRERKKFDPVATTGKEALTTISAGGLVFFSGLSLISYLGNLGDLSERLGIAALTMGLVHLWGVRKFLVFAAMEEGMLFAVESFFTGFVLYLVILSGAVASYFLPVKKK